MVCEGKGGVTHKYSTEDESYEWSVLLDNFRYLRSDLDVRSSRFDVRRIGAYIAIALRGESSSAVRATHFACACAELDNGLRANEITDTKTKVHGPPDKSTALQMFFTCSRRPERVPSIR